MSRIVTEWNQYGFDKDYWIMDTFISDEICFCKKIPLFCGETNVFHLWIMSIKYDFWNRWALYFGPFNLKKYCFFPQEKKKTYPQTQKCVGSNRDLTSKSKFLLTQDIINNNWNYLVPPWVLL